MTDESAELQLRRLLNKAIDDAWIAGFEKGKIEGRISGIEEAIGVIQSDDELTDEGKAELEAAIRALLEAKCATKHARASAIAIAKNARKRRSALSPELVARSGGG